MWRYEASPELINKIHTLLLNESGVPTQSTSSSSSSSPPPSILRDAISSVGSNSTDALRCDACTGELLLGANSVICIFCGNLPICPSHKPGIPFTSTLAFRWFLHSLSLDGSESVERVIEGSSESGRGRSSAVNEIPLAALLDMQLKWPDESNRFGLKNETGKKATNLVGLNFDEIFQTEVNEEEGASGSTKEKAVEGKNNEIKEDATFAVHSGLSLFENAQTGFNEGELGESDWAAEFQSVNADIKVESANIVIPQAPSRSIIELKSDPPFDLKQSESILLFEDNEKGLETVDPSFDWLPKTDKPGLSDKRDPLHDDKLDSDSAFDDWDQFGTFASAENNPREPIRATLPGTESSGGSDLWNDFSGSVGIQHIQLHSNSNIDKPVSSDGDESALWGHDGMEQLDILVDSTQNKTKIEGESLSGTSKGIDDSFDLWNDFESSTAGNDSNKQILINEEAVGFKLPICDGTFKTEINAASLSSGDKEHSVGSSEAVGVLGDSLAVWNDNSLDVWSDFARPTGVLDSKMNNNESSSGALSDFSSLMVTHANPPPGAKSQPADYQTSLQNDDDFGSWNDFRSSLKQPDDNFPELNLNRSSEDKGSTVKVLENPSLVKDVNSDNSWGDFSWSTPILEQQSNAVGANQSEDKPSIQDDVFFQYSGENQPIGLSDNQLKSNGLAVNDGMFSSGNDELIDDWTDYTSSSNKQANSNVNAAVIQEPVKHDPFDEWNVIYTAPNKQAGKDTALANDSFPQINMSRTDLESQVIEPNSLLNQDPFLGVLSDQYGSAEVQNSQTEVSNLVWTEHDHIKTSDFDQLNGRETDLRGTSNQASTVVENLISEMHDLSFMLESDLSIPKTGS